MTVCAEASSLAWIAAIVAASMLINLIATIWIHKGDKKMSNSPACPNHGPVFEMVDIGCPYCDEIRKAYLKGRTDAAHAIRKVPVIADGPACGLISDNDAFNAAEGKHE